MVFADKLERRDGALYSGSSEENGWILWLRGSADLNTWPPRPFGEFIKLLIDPAVRAKFNLPTLTDLVA